MNELVSSKAEFYPTNPNHLLIWKVLEPNFFNIFLNNDEFSLRITHAPHRRDSLKSGLPLPKM